MNRKKRLYFFVNDFGLTGSETMLNQFICDLSLNDKFDIFVVTTVNESKFKIDPSNKIVYKSFSKQFSIFEKLLYKLGVNVYNIKLNKLFADLKPDIVYLNTVNNAYLLPYLSKFKVVKILHIHELLMGLDSMSKMDYNNMIYLTEELVTCSELVTKLYEDIYDKNITQINSVPRHENISLKNNIKDDIIKSQKINIACAGTISYRKGFDRYLEVASKLSSNSFTLHWFGKFDNSAYSEWVKQKINLKKYSHIQIETYTSQEEYLNALANCSIFIFTSREESMGMVLFDAIYLGLPILSLEENGSKLILNDNINQFITLKDLNNIQNIIEDSINNHAKNKQSELSIKFSYSTEFKKFSDLFDKY